MFAPSERVLFSLLRSVPPHPGITSISHSHHIALASFHYLIHSFVPRISVFIFSSLHTLTRGPVPEMPPVCCRTTVPFPPIPTTDPYVCVYLHADRITTFLLPQPPSGTQCFSAQQRRHRDRASFLAKVFAFARPVRAGPPPRRNLRTRTRRIFAPREAQHMHRGHWCAASATYSAHREHTHSRTHSRTEVIEPGGDSSPPPARPRGMTNAPRRATAAGASTPLARAAGSPDASGGHGQPLRDGGGGSRAARDRCGRWQAARATRAVGIPRGARARAPASRPARGTRQAGRHWRRCACGC
ncbi:hypothetical protein BC834DRAFT_114946 [Gloeopeniophorella convolvens]|nr:hypothetical protein BC834DRAFT_114946 [Gloeopeniophorella convolvens]